MEAPILRLFEVVLWGERRDVPLQRMTINTWSEDEAKNEAVKHYRHSFGALCEEIKRIEVLSDVHLNPARKQQTLFEDLADLCLGHSMTDVQGAIVNLMLSVVQRRANNLADAETRWDELTGRGKVALQRRYGGNIDARDKVLETDIAKRLVA